MVSINAQWPGHSAEEVERLITVPIEREMNGIPKENNLPLGLALRAVRRRHHLRPGHRPQFRAAAGVQPPGRPRPAERGRAGRRAADLAVGPDLPLHAAEPRPLADRAQDLRGLDGRAAVPVGARRRRRFRLRRRHDAIPGAARPISSRRRRPVAATGRTRARRQQRQRRRRILFRGRAVLLRPRPRPAGRRPTTSAMSSSPCTTAFRPWSRMSGRSRSASPRGSASSGSTSRTTPSRASSCCAPARRRRTC